MARLMLLVLGVRVKVSAKSKIGNFGKGITLSNLSSLVDVLVIKAYFNVKFVRVFNLQQGIKKVEFYKPFGVLSDYGQCLNQLRSSHSQAPTGEIVRKEKFPSQKNSVIFYEGLITNNYFVQDIDDLLQFELFNIAREGQMNLRFLKIFHQDKQDCVPSGNIFVILFKTFSLLSNSLSVSCAEIEHKELQVMD